MKRLNLYSASEPHPHAPPEPKQPKLAATEPGSNLQHFF